MKILGIIGSPHGQRGNTGKLLGEVLKGAESEVEGSPSYLTSCEDHSDFQYHEFVE